MAKIKNKPEDETTTQLKESSVTGEVTGVISETTEESTERELTQEVLDKAIAAFKSENPDKVWEDVDQETRWKYLNAAY